MRSQQITDAEIVPDSKAIAVNQAEGSAFKSMDNFKNAMQMAEVLSRSDIIPANFKGKPHNCLIALEYANRLGESPFVIMQNVSVINGMPGLSSKYLISRINTSGLFSEPLEFEYSGDKGTDNYSCFAYTTRKNGKYVYGATISMTIAKNEGWFGRERSKWKTIPEQMLMYRAASFFVDKICPQLRFGMLTVDEIIDINQDAPDIKIDALNEKIKAKSADKTPKNSGLKSNEEII